MPFGKTLPTLALSVLLLGGVPSLFSQTAPLAKQIPVIDGGAGPCSVEFTVTDTKGNHIYDAKVAVRIAYGFAGMRKLDLQVGTNVDGKARFTGLPSSVKSGALLFRASHGDLIGTTYYNPTTNCNAQQDIVISSDSQ